MAGKVKGLVKRVDRLSVNDGDVLLIYAGQPCTPEMMESFRATINPWRDSRGLDGVLLAVAEPGLEIRALNEGDMERLGWAKVNTPCPSEGVLTPAGLTRTQLLFYLGQMAKSCAKSAERLTKQAGDEETFDQLMFGSEADMERLNARTLQQAIDWLSAMPEGWSLGQEVSPPCSKP